MAQFMGGVELWIHADIDDHEFRAHISYAIGLQLWPLASGERLERLRRHLRAAWPSANVQQRRDDAIPSNQAQRIKGKIPA